MVEPFARSTQRRGDRPPHDGSRESQKSDLLHVTRRERGPRRFVLARCLDGHVAMAPLTSATSCLRPHRGILVLLRQVFAILEHFDSLRRPPWISCNSALVRQLWRRAGARMDRGHRQGVAKRRIFEPVEGLIRRRCLPNARFEAEARGARDGSPLVRADRRPETAVTTVWGSTAPTGGGPRA